MVAKVASQANPWYNKRINIVAPAMLATSRGWTHLVRRCILDILSQKTCSKCNNPYLETLEYFPPEKKGKNGLSAHCRMCERARQKKYRNTPEYHTQHIAYMKEYHSRPDRQERNQAYNRTQERRSYMRAYMRNRYEQPEIQEYYRTYHQRPEVRDRLRRRAAQPEQIAMHRRRGRAYYQRPEVQERQRAYRESYYQRPEVKAHRIARYQEYWKREDVRNRHHVHRHERRARIRAATGTHTPEQIRAQYDRQNGMCYYCQMAIEWRKHHVDHVIPLSRGGSNDISNLVIACPVCNASKRDKLPHEFFKGGRLL